MYDQTEFVDAAMENHVCQKRSLTLSAFLFVFDRLEVDDGHGSNKLHRGGLDQTAFVDIPSGALQIHPTDVHSLLSAKRTRQRLE